MVNTMSEIRVPDEIISIRLPLNSGSNLPRISTKYELFKAKQFASHYDPRKRGTFTPTPPLNTAQRQEFWKSMYRLRVNGKWQGEGKYTLFTREEVFMMILNSNKEI